MYKFNLILCFITIQNFCSWYLVIAYNNTHPTPGITRTEKFYVRLLCADTNFATVQWDFTRNTNFILENSLAAPIYSTEWNNEIKLTLTLQNKTIKEDTVENSNNYTFRKLQPESQYHLLVNAKNVDGTIISTSLNFSTASKNIKYHPPTKFEVVRLINISNTRANILVEWEPSKHFPACSYNVSWSYLFNTSSTVVQTIDTVSKETILENLVYNVCYNLSLTPVFGEEINSTNEAHIDSFCPMSKGRNMSGICICTDQICSVTINWDPVNVSQDFIQTSISSNNQSILVFKNVSKTATSVMFPRLEISSDYEFKITTNTSNGPYSKEFLANPNSACLLFIPNAPKMTEVKFEKEIHKSGFCSLKISWGIYYEEPDQVLVEIIQPGLKVFESFDKSNLTDEPIILKNLTLESYFQMEMSVIFNQITVCKYTWKNLSCFKPETVSIIEQRFDHLFVIGILAFMAVIWTFLLALLIFHKLKISNPIYRRKQCIIQIKNAEYHLIKETKPYQPEYGKLIIGDMLGRGAFGIVFKGILILKNGKESEVAVKTLRNDASQKEILQLKKEISLMENIGIHKNIISIIGSVCDGNKPLLIVEFCPQGDLHAYLRKNYDQISKNLDDLGDKSSKLFFQDFASHFDFKNQNSVENKLYGLVTEGTTSNSDLTFCDLLSFARQVAIGMEYLASNYVVHRDLAARNILLSDNKTVKISDFGLSRDIYTENIYRITGKGERMPIKWMALESIRLQEYTTQTDVWSFGVFLWELFSLGEEPYREISSPEVLYFRLKDGNRLDCPPLAVNDLYDIMLQCWHEIPEVRPSFSMLREKLDDLLKTNASNQYLPLINLYQKI